MQLTTHQLYALAVMAVLIIILIGISYVSGLRTGRKAGEAIGYDQGRSTAAKYWKEMIAGIRESSEARIQQLRGEVAVALQRQQANAREAARLSERASQLDAETTRLDDVVGRLHAKVLTPDDLFNLKLAARQLGQAARQFSRSGTSKTNQPELAQKALTAIIERYTEAQQNPQPRQQIERDEDGYIIQPPINWIGDGKDTWERIDDEHRALGLPPAMCM
ncbi:hypothetical protein F471_03713 [Pseudomonas sp. URMO17WK12:I1]|uniref:hypothetical protein n=1 Tax=unclassified Pseudomonas TaxID=196821 RepID=UPI000486826F|nr:MULTISPECIES: hypothetical protein [unclassified Pseudomonas]PZW65235.1 hypothetical protein F471_03713 [Pseudomonas sp. URMO17WK12:I1]